MLVPCYNYGRFLADAVDSVLAQDVDVRVLIIDDASQDETPGIGRALAERDRRVEFRRHPINRGHIATYNEGIDWADRDFFLLLSADDLLMPGALTRAAAAFSAEPDLLMVYGRALHFVDDLPIQEILGGSVLVRPFVDAHLEYFADGSADGVAANSLEGPRIQTPTVLDTPDFYRLNKSANRVHACGAVTRAPAQRTLGGYLPTLPHSGDYEMWLRFSAHGPVGHISRFQVAARHHSRNMSAQYDYMSDVLQRAMAIQELEETCGSLLPPGLLGELREGIAAEALRATSGPLRQGLTDKRARLVETAKALDPAITRRWIWGMYMIKVAVGPRVWSLLGKLAPPVVLKKWRA